METIYSYQRPSVRTRAFGNGFAIYELEFVIGLREETLGDDGYELFMDALRKQGEAHTKLVMKTTARRSSSSSLFQLGATARELAKRVGIPLRSSSSKGETTPDPSTNGDTAGRLADTQPS